LATGCTDDDDDDGERRAEWKQRRELQRKRRDGGKRIGKRTRRDEGRGPADSAGKENIRSPFIFINKTSRRGKKRGRGSRDAADAARGASGREGERQMQRGATGRPSAAGRRGGGGLRLFLNNNEMQSSR